MGEYDDLTGAGRSRAPEDYSDLVGSSPPADHSDLVGKPAAAGISGHRIIGANFARADDSQWPTALAAVAGTALPASPLIAAAGGALLGTLGRAGQAAVDAEPGERVGAALEAANPLHNKLALALEMGLPFVGSAITRGLAARRVSDLPGFEEATKLDAPLPELDELVSYASPDTISRSAADLPLLKGAREKITAAAPYLVRQESEAARIAGDRLYSAEEVHRKLLTNGQKIIARATKGLKPVELETMTQVLHGDIDPKLVTPRIAQAAAQMREQFYDPMGRLAERSGVLTEVKAGENVGDWVPFQMKSGPYSPEIPLDPKKYVKTSSLRSKLMRPSQVAYQRVDELEDVPLMTNARDIAHEYLQTMSRKIATSHAFGSPTKSGKYGEIGEQLLGQLYAEADRDPLAPRLFEHALDRFYTPRKEDGLGAILSAAQRTAAKVQLGKAALRSIPQIGANIRQHGLGHTIEGLAEYATDPSYRQAIDTSGALSASMAEHGAELGVGARTLPMRMQRGIERFNRGIANAGIGPRMRELAAAAQAGKLNSAQMRILEELRIPAEDLQQGLTADLLSRAIQRSADDNQLQASAIGQMGDFAHDQPWKMLTQYQPFQWAQWRQAQHRMLDPLIHPKGPADFLMGLRRTATGLPATAALAAPVTATYALMSGREPEPAQFVGDALETTYGTGGAIASEAIQGRNALAPLIPGAPAKSLVDQAWEHPEGIPLDLAAILDPTGTMAVLRAPLRYGIREATR